MEEGEPGDAVTLGFEPRTLGFEHGGQRVQRIKTAVDERKIGERPQPFSGLEFRTVGRQDDDFYSWWLSLRRRDREASPILDKQYVMRWPGEHTGGEGLHDQLMGMTGHLWNEPQVACAAPGTHEGVHIQPLAAGLDGTGQGLTRRRPDRAGNGFEADSVLIHRSQRHERVEPLRAAERLH